MISYGRRGSMHPRYGSEKFRRRMDTGNPRFCDAFEENWWISDESGFPLSYATATKLGALREFCGRRCMYWGRRPMHRREDLQAWAVARAG